MAKFKRAADIHGAVIGYGGSFDMGTWHFRLMRRAGIRPIAVVDSDPPRRALAQEQAQILVQGLLSHHHYDLAI